MHAHSKASSGGRTIGFCFAALVVLGLGATAASAGTLPAAPAAVAPAATTLAATAYQSPGSAVRPSAEYGLAVFDRQLSRSLDAHGYRYPGSRYAAVTVGYGHYRHYRPYRYYGPYRSYYWSYPFSFYGAWGYPGAWDRYDYGWYPDAGALDLNIKPKRAEVWVDREYLGSVDSYDGFPRYLWLQPGEHHLVVYLDGHETFARKVTLRRGEILAIRYELREGVARQPEEVFATLEPERPESDSREARAERPERREPLPDPQARRPREDWRDRGAARVEVDQRAEPGRLRLRVVPEDAVVYLDGRLLGSGAEIGRLHSDLLVDAGAHRLEATRPGYRAWEREIEVAEGEELVVRVELERDR
jgi:hypothetical protein